MLIAQLSDCHLGASADVFDDIDTGKTLQRSIAAIESLDPYPDVVLFTGDITDTGDRHAYKEFIKLVAPLRAPLHVIPGNHDKRTVMHAAFSGTGFALDPHGDQSYWQYVLEGWPLRIIMLDTLWQGRAEGHLCSERLSQLEKWLAAAPEQPTLIAMHHPPFLTGIAGMDRIRCHDNGELAALLSQHRQVVRLVSGHVHRSVFGQFAGIPASIAPAIAPAIRFDLSGTDKLALAAEPAAMHLHHWTADAGMITHTYYL